MSNHHLDGSMANVIGCCMETRRVAPVRQISTAPTADVGQSQPRHFRVKMAGVLVRDDPTTLSLGIAGPTGRYESYESPSWRGCRRHNRVQSSSSERSAAGLRQNDGINSAGDGGVGKKPPPPSPLPPPPSLSRSLLTVFLDWPLIKLGISTVESYSVGNECEGECEVHPWDQALAGIWHPQPGDFVGVNAAVVTALSATDLEHIIPWQWHGHQASSGSGRRAADAEEQMQSLRHSRWTVKRAMHQSRRPVLKRTT